MTSETLQHLPGPWRCDDEGQIMAADNALIACVMDNWPEWEANARLVVAAPDLLAAAKLVARCRRNEYIDAVAIDACCAAVAAAQGTTP